MTCCSGPMLRPDGLPRTVSSVVTHLTQNARDAVCYKAFRNPRGPAGANLFGTREDWPLEAPLGTLI